MSSEQLSNAVSPLAEEPSAEEVQDFLEAHPEFLSERPDLLMALSLPHSGGGAVSLVERQVQLLRQRNDALAQRLEDITERAENNDNLFTGTRQTVVALVSCREKSALAACFRQQMLEEFDVQYANLVWFESGPATDTEASKVKALVRRQHAFCGVFRQEEMAALFPESHGEGSAAIAPLVVDDTVLGVIAVGSSDVHRYDTRVGTLFLEHLAEVIINLQYANS